MNRRDVIGITSALSLAGVASAVLADAPAAPGHEHHGSGMRYADLIAASSHCVMTGDACLTHCLTMLGEGDKELVSCARTARDIIAACTALRELAAANSPHVQALSKVVSAMCADCEAECRKHEQHAVCKDCETACHDCKALCDKAAMAA